MPIYGYRCEQCGHELEIRQSMSDEPLRVCPNCLGPLHKMVYPAGIIFKGSGYYTTDYPSASKSAGDGDGGGGGSSETAAKSESKGEAKSDPKGDSKGESKSESKSDSAPAKETPSKPAKTAKPAAD
jgi:putative FmdB family regulatory protein